MCGIWVKLVTSDNLEVCCDPEMATFLAPITINQVYNPKLFIHVSHRLVFMIVVFMF